MAAVQNAGSEVFFGSVFFAFNPLGVSMVVPVNYVVHYPDSAAVACVTGVNVQLQSLDDFLKEVCSLWTGLSAHTLKFRV